MNRKRILMILCTMIWCTTSLLAVDIPNNEIWYTSKDGSIIAPYDASVFGANIVSNTYSGGKGIIKFDGNVTSIGKAAFYRCTSLTSITIPNSVTSIGKETFESCYGLTSVSIPNSVTSIGEYAFYKCSFLSNLTIGNSVNTIGVWAFGECTALRSVTIPSSIKKIENGVFADCSDLTTISIPNSVKSIGGWAFQNCTSLTSISIPNSVTNIATHAFIGCTGLTSVSIPNSVTSIESAAFYHVRNIFYSGTATGSPWGALCVNGYVEGDLVYSNSTKTHLAGCANTATNVTIPNSVTSIGEYAFEECTGLTSVSIPNSVTSIGQYAFQICSNLSKVNITDVAAWCRIVFSDSESNPLYYAHNLYLNDEKITTLNIPNSVTSIGEYAFYKCTGLTSVSISNSVTSIGENAFQDCTGLTSVSIPNGVTSIGDAAFHSCTNLTSVTIGNRVTSIGSGAFRDCTSITSITIPNGVTSIGSSAFYGCTGLTKIISYATIPPSFGTNAFYNVDKSIPVLVPSASIDQYKSADGWKEFTNIQSISRTITAIAADNLSGSVSGGGTYDYGTSVTLTATPKNHYHFVRWSDGDTNATRTITVTADATYTAEFAIDQFTVSFKNYDGTILQSSQVDYGTTPTYTGQTPTKAKTAKYTYSFKGWNPSITSVTGNATYTAVFDSVVNKYTITFKNEDGTILQSSAIEYDQLPKYNGVTPTKPSTAQYTYTFAGWSPAISLVKGDATYTATYTTSTGKYLVSFLNYDGTVLQSSQVDYGITPSYSGQTPTKAKTAKYTYTFNGWSPTIVPVAGEATYKAEYDSVINKYMVIFQNDNGTTLQATEVEYDQMPVYTGVNPTKQATAQYTYTFAGWDPAISPVAGNVTYKATYTYTVNKYEITFVNYDGSTLQSNQVDYGVLPTYRGVTPAKPATKKYSYIFNQWSPAIKSVTSEATYKAVFDSVINKYTITFQNDDGTILQSTEVEYDQMPVYTGVNPTKQATAQYTYTFAGWSPELTLVEDDATYQATYSSTVNRYTITLTSSDAQMGSVEGGGTFDYNTSIVVSARSEYGYAFSQWSDGNTDNPRTIVVKADAKYIAQFIAQQFEIWVASADFTMGTAFGSGMYDYNTDATLTAVSNEGYVFDKWDDDNTDNPRVVHVTEEHTFIASFKLLTALNEVSSSKPKTQKVIINGHLYILRDGKMYNAQGAIVDER